MTSLIRNCIFIISGLFQISCATNSEKKGTDNGAIADSTKKPDVPRQHHFKHFETGKVISHIKCGQDTNETWSLYLPKGYDTLKSYQVIFFLDAHARGALPLKKYMEIAEKHKMIFIGSDVSQNGLKQEAYDKIVDDMVLASQDVLNIDEKTVTFAGFSGGAKVAGAAAIRKGNINTVIGCAAPMAIDNLGSSYFHYIGVAGKADFNYWDMVDLDKQFTRTPLKHQLLTFEGKHEWPDVQTMDEAIFLARANEMKNKSIPVDNKIVDYFFKLFAKKEAVAAAAHQYLEMYDLDGLISENFNGLKDVKLYRSRQDSIRSTGACLKPQNDNDFLRKAERTKKDAYIKGLQQPGFDWDVEIKKLSAKTDAAQTWENKRLLAFINMLAYLKTTELLNGNRLDEAGAFLKTFIATDPKNPDGAYLTADYFALKGDKPKALASLNEALKMGYDDFAHFSTDPMLAGLKNDPGYAKVYRKLASM
jgi:hypothetical protein